MQRAHNASSTDFDNIQRDCNFHHIVTDSPKKDSNEKLTDFIGIKKCDCENIQRDTQINCNNMQRACNCENINDETFKCNIRSLSGSLRTMERLDINNLKCSGYLVGESFDFEDSER